MEILLINLSCVFNIAMRFFLPLLLSFNKFGLIMRYFHGEKNESDGFSNQIRKATHKSGKLSDLALIENQLQFFNEFYCARDVILCMKLILMLLMMMTFTISTLTHTHIGVSGRVRAPHKWIETYIGIVSTALSLVTGVFEIFYAPA